jgi:hypothetical protein
MPTASPAWKTVKEAMPSAARKSSQQEDEASDLVFLFGAIC